MRGIFYHVLSTAAVMEV